MATIPHRKALLEAVRQQLATEIKLDIARELRHHPMIAPGSAKAAFNTLASDTSVEAIIADLARSEAASSLAAGELPAAAMFHLGGFRQNIASEG